MSNFIHAMKSATALLLEGKKDEAEAVLHAYFHGSQARTLDDGPGGSGSNGPPPKIPPKPGD